MQKRIVAPLCAFAALLAVVWFVAVRPHAPGMVATVPSASAPMAPPSLAPQPMASAPLTAEPVAARDTVVLIIRHAEKPDQGRELAPAGVRRADAYVNYFKNYTIDGKPIVFDHLFATADSKGSMRPRLTITPLSQALGMPLDLRFKEKNGEEMCQDILTHWRGRNVLICWHHGAIPDLLAALGADPAQLLRRDKWPGDTFNWVVQLVYDPSGKLIDSETKVIDENLMPGDAANTP